VVIPTDNLLTASDEQPAGVGWVDVSDSPIVSRELPKLIGDYHGAVFERMPQCPLMSHVIHTFEHDAEKFRAAKFRCCAFYLWCTRRAVASNLAEHPTFDAVMALNDKMIDITLRGLAEEDVALYEGYAEAINSFEQSFRDACENDTPPGWVYWYGKAVLEYVLDGAITLMDDLTAISFPTEVLSQVNDEFQRILGPELGTDTLTQAEVEERRAVWERHAEKGRDILSRLEHIVDGEVERAKRSNFYSWVVTIGIVILAGIVGTSFGLRIGWAFWCCAAVVSIYMIVWALRSRASLK
jgi:hypothetical protein